MRMSRSSTACAPLGHVGGTEAAARLLVNVGLTDPLSVAGDYSRLSLSLSRSVSELPPALSRSRSTATTVPHSSSRFSFSLTLTLSDSLSVSVSLFLFCVSIILPFNPMLTWLSPAAQAGHVNPGFSGLSHALSLSSSLLAFCHSPLCVSLSLSFSIYGAVPVVLRLTTWPSDTARAADFCLSCRDLTRLHQCSCSMPGPYSIPPPLSPSHLSPLSRPANERVVGQCLTLPAGLVTTPQPDQRECHCMQVHRGDEVVLRRPALGSSLTG